MKTLPEKLNGTFWGITTYYNPQKYRNKIENYRKFRNASKRQGLKLLTVELAFGDNDFELKKSDYEKTTIHICCVIFHQFGRKCAGQDY